MNRRWGVAVGLVIAAGLAVLLGIELVVVLAGGVSGGHQMSLPGMRKVAVLPVTGIIINTEDYIRFVREQREDDAVKGLLLRIDSPGGGAAASQELFTELMKFRETGRPIVASVGSLGASGGYYLAAAADTIFVNACSEVGSIGVIMDYYNVNEMLKKLGIAEQVYTAGRMKDVPSSNRAMTPEETAYLQGILDDVHQQFIGDICRGRGMARSAVAPHADGRIFTGRQALALGLVDAIGTYEDARDAVARAAGISGTPHYAEYEPPEEKGLFAAATSFAQRLRALLPPPQATGGLRFQYAQ
ncbi:MAG TPA: signal peptide peptidase SppA [bacterium]|nr:signal peptide peptidase SppA [bacterium]